MRRVFSLLFVMFVLFVGLGGTVVSAQSLDDLRGGIPTVSGDVYQSGTDGGLTDYLRNYRGVTSKDMERASRYAGPVASVIGTVTGFVILLVWSAVGLFSALDLLYLVAPPLRGFMNPDAGGMRWVSDEAISVLVDAGIAQGGGMAQGAGMSRGGLPGGRFGRNAMMHQGGMMQGGMMSGGMMPGMAGGMQGNMSGGGRAGWSILILSYMKKRTVAVVLFFAASVILTSSVLVGAGLNLAEAVLRLITVGVESFNSFR